VDYDDLTIIESHLLGEGKFSKCYLARLHGTEVAVKIYNVNEKMSQEKIQSFHHEGKSPFSSFSKP
jgi:predicted Ser/Thr protein kinase